MIFAPFSHKNARCLSLVLNVIASEETVLISNFEQSSLDFAVQSFVEHDFVVSW